MGHPLEPNISVRAEHLKAEAASRRGHRAQITRHAILHAEQHGRRVVGVDSNSAAKALAVNLFDRAARVDHSVNGVDPHGREAAARRLRSVGRTAAYDVFVGGVGGAPHVGYKRDAFVDPETTPVASTLDIVAKDLDLIARLAARAGAPMPQTETTRDLVQQALRAGFSGRDLSAIAEFLRDQ